jgi:hypothetical protein
MCTSFELSQIIPIVTDFVHNTIDVELVFLVSRQDVDAIDVGLTFRAILIFLCND